jgi:hypothetical protein
MDHEDNVIIHSTLEDGEDFFITDRYKKKYHFKISVFDVPSGVVAEAMQVVSGNGQEPYLFHMLFDFDVDQEYAELKLKQKIKKGIDKRYLQVRNKELSINKSETLVGRLEWNDNMNDTEFDSMLVVDGKRITIEKLVKLLEPYGGFNIKITIHDLCDEIPE